jgi:hypothetical protein
MRIDVRNGKQTVKLTALEIDRIKKVRDFTRACPGGLYFERERAEMQEAVEKFLKAVFEPGEEMEKPY